MSDNFRSRRLGGASRLQQEIDALDGIASEHRPAFLHDRLVSAIDDICQAEDGKKACFSKDQITVIKDISFYIVHMVDPKRSKKIGFLSAIWLEFKAQSPMKKIAVIAAVIAATLAVVGFLLSAHANYQKHGPWGLVNTFYNSEKSTTPSPAK